MEYRTDACVKHVCARIAVGGAWGKGVDFGAAVWGFDECRGRLYDGVGEVLGEVGVDRWWVFVGV
jgi:hypothetical protein